MSIRTKLIVSEIELPKKTRELLSRATRDYELLTAENIKRHDYGDVEILLCSYRSNLVSKGIIALMPKLRLIQLISAGVDRIDFNAIPPNVMVCGNVGAYGEPIAEHVIGLILSAARKIVPLHNELRRGVFRQRSGLLFLKGKQLCVLGTGGIGVAVARLAKAFGMATYGINKDGTAREYFDRVGTMRSLPKTLSDSDIVVISLPLTTKTRGLVGSEQLRLMKETAILINVSRGPIIRQKDLYQFLKVHKNFQVATDVWWKYPKAGEAFAQDYPFFSLPNFIGTPHTAGEVLESSEIACNCAMLNIIRYIKKAPVKGLASPRDYLGLRGSRQSWT